MYHEIVGNCLVGLLKWREQIYPTTFARVDKGLSVLILGDVGGEELLQVEHVKKVVKCLQHQEEVSKHVFLKFITHGVAQVEDSHNYMDYGDLRDVITNHVTCGLDIGGGRSQRLRPERIGNQLGADLCHLIDFDEEEQGYGQEGHVNDRMAGGYIEHHDEVVVEHGMCIGHVIIVNLFLSISNPKYKLIIKIK